MNLSLVKNFIAKYSNMAYSVDLIPRDSSLQYRCGFRGILGDWFSSYFSNRKQYLCCSKEQSTLEAMKTGVPTRISAGFISFHNIFANDMTNDLNDLKPRLFVHVTLHTFCLKPMEFSKSKISIKQKFLTAGIKCINYVEYANIGETKPIKQWCKALE